MDNLLEQQLSATFALDEDSAEIVVEEEYMLDWHEVDPDEVLLVQPIIEDTKYQHILHADLKLRKQSKKWTDQEARKKAKAAYKKQLLLLKKIPLKFSIV